MTSTGEYVVAWDFAKVKKGQLDKYEIKKCVCHPPSTSASASPLHFTLSSPIFLLRLARWRLTLTCRRHAQVRPVRRARQLQVWRRQGDRTFRTANRLLFSVRVHPTYVSRLSRSSPCRTMCSRSTRRTSSGPRGRPSRLVEGAAARASSTARTDRLDVRPYARSVDSVDEGARKNKRKNHQIVSMPFFLRFPT